MLVFFTMGFVDLVGIASNYVKLDLGLTDSEANIFPSLVFFSSFFNLLIYKFIFITIIIFSIKSIYISSICSFVISIKVIYSIIFFILFFFISIMHFSYIY